MKILIATDGSDASRLVIETACEVIAKPESTTVKIISAVETSRADGSCTFRNFD